MAKVANRGGLATRRVTNDLARELNSFSPPLMGMESLSTRLHRSNNMVGIVVTAGEDGETNFFDNRYWVRCVAVVGFDETEDTAQMEFDDLAVGDVKATEDPEADPEPTGHIFEVTNLAEQFCFYESGTGTPPADITDGHGVHMVPPGTIIQFGPRVDHDDFDKSTFRYVTFTVPRSMAPLVITGADTGTGKYTGFELMPPTIVPTGATDLDDEEMIGHRGPRFVNIWSLDEIGTPDHAITEFPVYKIGYMVRTNDNGRRSYVFAGGAGGGLPPGGNKWEVLSTVDDVHTVAWDRPRFA